MHAELFEGDGGFDDTETAPAIRLRHHHAEDAQSAELLPAGPVDRTGLSISQPVEREPFGAVLAHDLLQRQLSVVEAEVHAPPALPLRYVVGFPRLEISRYSTLGLRLRTSQYGEESPVDDDGRVLLERDESTGIARLTLNNPERRNSYDP